MASGGRVLIHPGLLERRGAAGVVVLDSTGDGAPVRMVGTAAEIWALLRAGTPIDDVVAAMGTRYHGDLQQVANDVHSFVKHLHDLGLVA